MQSFKMAVKSIAGNKMRAVLTMLGIIIGVMALVILVSLVNGATSSVTDTVSGLGNDVLTVSISDDKDKPVTLSDLAEWNDEKDIGLTAPGAEESVTVKYGTATDSMTVYGATPAYYDIKGLSILLGRFIKTTDVDNNNNVCVINETTAADIVGYTDCIGEEISINGMKYTIVGVLADDDSLAGTFESNSNAAYIPYTSFVRISDSATLRINNFYVSAAADSTMEAAENSMTQILMDRFSRDDDAFTINSSDAMESAMSSITSMLTILLGGIAAISLIVGGIGIMNIMLVTVTERTREIGIRKAIGATRGDILRQFLIEALVLCMTGCAIGIFLSWCVLKIAGIIVSGLSLTFDMNGTVVLVAGAFCFAIGIVFGIYPANKAAKMKPIDSLHYGG